MWVLSTWLLLSVLTAVSDGRLFPRPGVGNDHMTVEMTLKDLDEAENPINLRGYSGVCDVTYVKVGCYNDKSHQALGLELFQDRSSTGDVYSGQKINWGEYATYLKGLACRCADEAQKRGFTHFGLQDYGRCYSAHDASRHYEDYGSSTQCSDRHYLPCDDNAWGECVGKSININYVYRITEASSGDGEIAYRDFSAADEPVHS